MSETLSLSVPTMKCQGCVSAVEEALQGLSEARSVTVDLGAKEARVTHDGTLTAERAAAAVREAGHEVLGA